MNRNSHTTLLRKAHDYEAHSPFQHNNTQVHLTLNFTVTHVQDPDIPQLLRLCKNMCANTAQRENKSKHMGEELMQRQSSWQILSRAG